MNQSSSIESIWNDDFVDDDQAVPKLDDLYRRKSLHVVDRTIHRLTLQAWVLLPLGLAMFGFNIWLDNDNSVMGGLFGAALCLLYFGLGLRQINELKRIDHGKSCYHYLTAVQQQLLAVAGFNRRLTIVMVHVIVVPMAVYTYFNQRGKTVGEVVGVDSFDWPMSTFLLLIPIASVLVFVVTGIAMKTSGPLERLGIGELLDDMEHLRK